MIDIHMEKKITALYERLSRDDELRENNGFARGESNSIVNQKKMLEEYAKKNGFSNLVHYTDDGYSGGNFERPSWKRMIADIESGKIGCVIAKDMSRIGREYLQTGFYTEVMFRQQGVRFIAISNGVDSNDKSSSEFAPFLNIMNEWYLRDCSRKQLAAYKLRGEAGKHTGAHPPYGYKKSPDDKHQWIIDEEAAAVVKRIFNLSIAGYGVGQIAKILMNDKIERPSYYAAVRGLGTLKNSYNAEHPYDWSPGTVSNIIARPEYIGHTVNFRTYKENYKDHKRLVRPRNEWKIFENTHEAIVDKDTWNLAQKLKNTPRRANETETANPFTGLLYCADCGAKMHNHRGCARAARENKTIDPVTGLYPYEHYECASYSLSYSHSRRACFSHYINGNPLYTLVLETIRFVSKYAISDKDKFIEKVKEASKIKLFNEAEGIQKKLRYGERRYNELDGIIKKLYESYVTGKISEKRFEMLSAEYENEQSHLSDEIRQIKSELQTYEDDEKRTNQFLELAEKYTQFSALTPYMINEFIEKIIIHAADKTSGERVQEIEIHLKFTGGFDIPAQQPTMEELEQIERENIKRQRHRDAANRYNAKKRKSGL